MLLKQMCLNLCQQHLVRYGKNVIIFLVIIGDEMWIQHCELEHKQQRMNGNIHSHPARRSSKANHLQEN
jgi:hypothetical protein